MIKFRKATENDYTEFIKLYEDYDSDILYRSNENKVDSSKELDLEEFYFETDNYTFCKYKREISVKYEKITMILEKKIIGYVKIFQIKRSNWKIHSICILPSWQTKENLKEIIKYLQEKQKIRKLDISPLYYRTIEWLIEECDFKPIYKSSSYLRKKAED